jgi:hypothetical protein
MKPQEVITIVTDVSVDSQVKGSVTRMHPELDQFFDKGMYIEKVLQSCPDNGRCVITFVFRYYNTSQSKIN